MKFRRGLMFFTACCGTLGGSLLVNAWAQDAGPAPVVPTQQPTQRLNDQTSQTNIRFQLAEGFEPVGNLSAPDAPKPKAASAVRMAQAQPASQPTIQSSPVGRNSGSGAVPNPSAGPGGGANPSALIPSSASGGGDEPIADVVIKKRELLLKQKDVPSGITEIGPKDIQSVGELTSVQGLLQQSAPSVNVYSQGLGQDVPVISVRGVRGSDLATTLDGIPTQDLLNGGSGSFLANNIGSPFDINQISGVTVQPGVSPPGVQGYGTIGGTLAYNSKRPTDERYYDLFSGIGSYGTDHYGLEFNSGKIAAADNLKVLFRYDRGESAGYIDYTQAKYRNIYLAIDKPYGNGLSNVGLTFISNTANGYLQASPIQIQKLAQFGQFNNYDKSQDFFRQDNSFLTAILSDDTYINDYVKIGGKAFYLRADNASQSYVSPSIIGADQNFQPNFQVPFFIRGQIGPGTPFFNKQYFNYDPSIFGNPTGNGPDGNPGNSPQGFGENASLTTQISDTYGIKPEVNLFLPFNNIRIGALVAREQQDNNTYYYGKLPIVAQKGYNDYGQRYDERQLYEGYIQDRIDLLHNTLHIEPGFTYEGVGAQTEQPYSFGAAANRLNPPNGGYRLSRFDREALPYIGASYDLPGPLKNVSVYSSWGRSALYAPVSDYALSGNGTTAASGPERLTAVEVGAKYNTDRLYLNVNYFNQRVTRAFSFFANYISNTFQFANEGIEEFKGFEASFKYKVTPEIGVFGAGSHVLAKYLQNYAAFTTIFNDQFGYAFRGTGVSGVPDYTANIGADYDRKNVFKDQDEAYLRLWMVYTGQQYTTYDISPDPTVTPNPQLQAATVTNTGFKLSAYAIFNLSLHYSLPVDNLRIPIKKLDFQFNVLNLFNQSYKAYFYNQYVSYNGVYGGAPYSTFVPGAPAAVLFNVSARF